MPPARCKILVESKPNPPPPPSNDEGASKTGTETKPQEPTVTVKFLYATFADLFMQFLDEKKGGQSKLADASLDDCTVSLKFDVTWKLEKDELVFDNQEDAAEWKKMIPFYKGSPEKLKNFDMEPERFRELLSISSDAFKAAWDSSKCIKVRVPRSSATEKKKNMEDKSNKKATEEEEDSDKGERRSIKEMWNRKWKERRKKKKKEKEEEEK